MEKNESELFGGKKPVLIEKMDPAQEDPRLIKALERNDGDFKATILELMEDFENGETRTIIARLIRKKNEQERVLH